MSGKPVDVGQTRVSSRRAARTFTAPVCALGMWMSPGSAAQSVDAVFKGMVTDISGAIVTGATVTARNLETGLVSVMATDEAGL